MAMAAASSSSSTLAPGLARKLKKVLQTRTDAPDVLASLATLSTFYDDNTPQARRNLQATIEKRHLAINDEFLRASEAAHKALDVVEMEVSALALSCDRIAESLRSCSAATAEILATVNKLQLDLDNTNQRQQIVSSFLQNYQLTPQEVQALREEELGQGFFQALSRVQEIHANCKILLRTHHQRAGLELMDMMAVYQEGAYERLCRWVQSECRNLSDSDHPEVSDLLRTASRCLKERPVLFKYCAEEVANTRHNALFRRFISALTRGGVGGTPRPIEVHAHDPLRYVGDMLAWLHQALASERELVMALFVYEEEGATADLGFVLDRIFEGVCRPFKVRVEQVLQSQPGLLLAYKLCNLLGFYGDMMGGLLPSEANLSKALREVKDAADRTFFDILKVRGDRLVRYPAPVPADLSPPTAVVEAVSVLAELIDAYNSMMVAAGRTRPDFMPVVAALVDPVVQMCERAAEAMGAKPGLAGRRLSNASAAAAAAAAAAASRSRSTTANSSGSAMPQDGASLRSIFMANCLSAIRQPLVSHAAASGYVERLEASLELHMAALVEQQASAILRRCGLSSLPATSSASEHDSSASKPEDEEVVRLLLKLVSDGVVTEVGSQLHDTRLRGEASARLAARLAAAYDELYTRSSSSSSSSSTSSSNAAALRHTPEQMRRMLGI